MHTTKETMTAPNVVLNTGSKMPQIGFGVWQIKGRNECVGAVGEALKAGYRHVDTAQIYGNEVYVGEAVNESGLERKELFITTKISVHNFMRVRKSFVQSLERLDMQYVDLLLLHFPVPGLRVKAWKHLEDIYQEGGAKAIGVSNYTVRHLKQLMISCRVKPAVNQVELHVFLQQPELVAFCEENGIVVQAYSPLAHAKGIDDKVLAEIAAKLNKTPAQIMLRWCIEAGTVPLPKSATPKRIHENMEIFDFELDIEDIQKIQQLDSNMRTCWDPTRSP
ncbi:MAG: aldo/keto reductase [bacterium]|nr:aldo/keto reductase [bacterium]